MEEVDHWDVTSGVYLFFPSSSANAYMLMYRRISDSNESEYGVSPDVCVCVCVCVHVCMEEDGKWPIH